MNMLVTAGNTLALIDKVRCITNIFSGRTGASIALEAHSRGHSVTLVTSHTEALDQVSQDSPVPSDERWAVRNYRTFEDLEQRLGSLIVAGGIDVVIHCAAVSDYLSGGIFAPTEGSTFDEKKGTWQGNPTYLAQCAAGKVKSDEPELWLRLVRAPKLIDYIRPKWGFRGLIVKFKLEVGLSDEELLKVADRSRCHSDANLMVANTLEGAPFYAFLGPVAGSYQRVTRRDLARKLLDAIESYPRI